MDYDYSSVNKETKNAAKIILDFLAEQPDLPIITEFQTLLTNILDRDISIKNTNPSVLISYDHEGRDGHFYAEGIIKFSEYLAAWLCRVEFRFYDVLGKHSELDFTMDEVKITYRDENSEALDSYGYELGLDDMKFSVVYVGIFEKLEKDVRKYMKTLEPIKPKDFQELRYWQIYDYAEGQLKQLLNNNY